MKSQITIPIFVPHLGCPHRCAFCNQNIQTASKYVNYSIIDEIKKYQVKSKASVSHYELAFFGGSFTAISRSITDKLLEQAKIAIDENLISSIRVSTRPDCITPEILQYLKHYGVQTVEIGAQSFFDDVLIASKRGHSVEDIINASKLIKDFGLNLVLQLLPGLPLDTKERSIYSAKCAVQCKPNAVRIYPAVVFKGKKKKKMMRDGLYLPLSVEEAVNTCAIMHTIFKDANIPVIRTGIHTLQKEEQANVVGGAYHNSLGFLVKCQMRRNELETLFKNANIGKHQNVSLVLPLHGKEEYIGQKKDNIFYIENVFNIKINYMFDEILQPKIIFV